MEALGITRHRTGMLIQASGQTDTFRFGGGANRVKGLSHHAWHVDEEKVELHFAGNDAAHVEQILDQLGLGSSTALDRRQCTCGFLAMPVCSTFTQPSIAAKGVRNSCETTERN